MPPLRILFIAPYVPSLTRVRPFNLIKQLAARGHRVTLCAVAAGGSPEADAAAIRPFCEAVEVIRVPRLRSWWNCVRTLPSSTPLQAMYGYSPHVQARVDALVGRQGATAFDLVHIEHLRAAWLGFRIRLPLVFDAVDCISQLFEQSAMLGSGRISRWSARLDLSRTRHFEYRLLEYFGSVLTTSVDERTALAGLAPAPRAQHLAQRIRVLRNGVDLDYFHPAGSAREPATLVFVGRMSYHANVSAIEFLVRDILPRVWQARPEVRLNVVGEDPHPQLRRWAAASGHRISVTGTVADVRPYVAQATIAVCPVTYAVGMQNKVLEAMAMATPTICTPLAARALSASDERELLIAGDASAFATRILGLLDDGPRRARLGAAARAYVERTHDWRGSGEMLETIYREEIGKAAMNNER
jgi:sugar transferase (PEP-CTERM/EpsH1 system associated)